MTRQVSLRLQDTILARIEREARARKVRRSAVIREALEMYLGGGARLRDFRPYDRVRDLVGVLTGGPGDLGARHREHLRDLIRDRR